MPLSINEEADRLLGVAAISTEPSPPSHPADNVPLRLNCPTCGSSHVAQMLGDNGGVSYVCTACGHSWS
ncbi:hypothetical protein [Streptomyces longispororuber]|uniref:hypothetical protein n=1 Tax=Streptomyces longispororuber TaxID=68230 RepID=UPI00210AD59E|nr:hypothetical protein [Streptomyces longispororuber]MCQ4208137.1 hypothetical protein [Streptomyces longispororuber]